MPRGLKGTGCFIDLDRLAQTTRFGKIVRTVHRLRISVVPGSVEQNPDEIQPPVDQPGTSSASLSKEVISATIKEAVSSLKTYFDGAISSIKRDNEKKFSATTEELEKYKKTSELSFRFKGNKAQFDFNVGVISKLEKVSEALQEKELEAATTTVKETIDEVKKRNKLIRLADKSDAG